VNTILIIDDSHEFTGVMARELRRRGYAVQTAHSGDAGLRLAAECKPRLVLLDLQLADTSGLTVLEQLKKTMPAVEVVIVTGHPGLPSALAAFRGDVLDYLCKPFSFEELDPLLTKVFHDPVRPAAAAGERVPAVEMIGESTATRTVRDLIVRLARSGVRAALITGESGTGKDLAARLFHAAGARHGGPFIEVNCSAVSEGLFESEFFGHERGAFTGAVTGRQGYAELADGGTLFLDEVAEIPLSCQPKLLRFLEDQSFLRVGGGRKITVDVQIIAATNRDLRAMVEQWTFRQDLYFRLNVVPVTIAPLRERPEDILPLARYWLGEANARYSKAIEGFTPEAEAHLLAHRWPGNVRELRNLVERLVILCPHPRIDVGSLPSDYLAAAGVDAVTTAPSRDGALSLEEAERVHIESVLARVSGNKTRAAEILGISRQTLRTKLAQKS
jgi:two-component system, NtrC family, response regulator AtoC